MVAPDARAQVTALVEQHKADEHDITYSTTVMRADGTRAESVNILGDRKDRRWEKVPHRHGAVDRLMEAADPTSQRKCRSNQAGRSRWRAHGIGRSLAGDGRAGDGNGRVGDQAALRAAGQFLARRRYQFPDVLRRFERGGVVVSRGDDRPRDPQSADRPRRRPRQRLRAVDRGSGALSRPARIKCGFPSHVIEWLGQANRTARAGIQTNSDYRIGELRVRSGADLWA